jgi:hypothetical protein
MRNLLEEHLSHKESLKLMDEESMEEQLFHKESLKLMDEESTGRTVIPQRITKAHG